MSGKLIRRHVSLTRALHARLYVNCEGRVFAVRGRMAREKLAAVLPRYDRWPSAAEAPTPSGLGVAACDGELSPHLLHCIGRALHRWSKELTAEASRRPARRRAAVALARERQEIERLTSRLAEVRNWQAEFSAGSEPPGAPFFLDSAAEMSLQAALADGIDPLPPLLAWQARVVFWLSGERAARRFLSALAAFLAVRPKGLRREKVRRFQQVVLVLQQRSGQESVRNLAAELASAVKRLPCEVLQRGFSARLRGRTFKEHCDYLVNRCTQIMAEEEGIRERRIPAAFASLVAADRSAVDIPQKWIRAAAEDENFAAILRTIDNVGAQIGQPGYDALLAVLDRLPRLLHETELEGIRRLLSEGLSVDDCIWAHEQGLLNRNSQLSIPLMRRLSDEFTQRGFPLSGSELDHLASHMQTPAHREAIRAWLAWLGSVSPSVVTPRMQKVLSSAFWGRYFPGVRREGWLEPLARCIETPRRTNDPLDYRPLLERITKYQQFAGRKDSLPKSLRKLLDIPERRRRERELLRARVASGELNDGSRTRWQRLEAEDLTLLNAGRIRRVAEQAFLLLGVEMLGAVSGRLAESQCRSYLGPRMTGQLTPDQVWDFSLWINAMSQPQRSLLLELISARGRCGPECRRYLQVNQSWIEQALARGMELDPWFAAEPQVATIGGRRMEIKLSSDLRHIFLMGAFFNTCLSQGGCNQMSVLANACDANKQVAFMFTEEAGRERIVARQLLAVSRDFKLLGYHCYVNSPSGRQHHEAIAPAMASYCGRLAARCGLELADEGIPEEIGEHFWYDDGECEWGPAARAAWAENVRERETHLV